MSDFSHPPGELSATGSNLPTYGVAEISLAIKRALEGTFARVRVRGEISGFKRAASGHLYMVLKDRDAVLDAVCWRGSVGRLSIQPEDGMEVIALGRITSYPGRSKYQIVIERLELAGEGALLKLLAERKARLAAEGLFDAARKRPLPFLPEVIGVVTSPTGAVIRDILHRLADRFPRRVLVWPVPVQGDRAAGRIAAAIRGFNNLLPESGIPRPDLLIVARGGGSLEDLWAFNEEAVVRAAAESKIPLISAVGHETDVTLLDFTADRRAPTPTAAAEMAVPVRADLVEHVAEAGRRMRVGWRRRIEERRAVVVGLGRGLPEPRRLLEEKGQRLDDRAERFANAAARFLSRRAERVRDLGARLPLPRRQWTLAGERLQAPATRLAAMLARPPILVDAARAVNTLGRVLESASYHGALGRGFAVVRGPEGVLTRARRVTAGLVLDIEFGDGRAAAVGAAVSRPPRRQTAGGSGDDPQGSLL